MTIPAGTVMIKGIEIHSKPLNLEKATVKDRDILV